MAWVALSDLVTELAALYDADDEERFPTDARYRFLSRAMRGLVQNLFPGVLISSAQVTLDGSGSYNLKTTIFGTDTPRPFTILSVYRDDDDMERVYLDPCATEEQMYEQDTEAKEDPWIWIMRGSSLVVRPDISGTVLTVEYVAAPDDLSSSSTQPQEVEDFIDMARDAILYKAAELSAAFFPEHPSVPLLMEESRKQQAKLIAAVHARKAPGNVVVGRR